MCFPVNFAKFLFLRTPFLQNISGDCFCTCINRLYTLYELFFGRKVRIPTDTKRRARFLFQLKKKLSDMYKLANEAMTTRQTKAQIKT